MLPGNKRSGFLLPSESQTNIMPDKSKAFSDPIPDGLIRILLSVDFVKTQIRNDAPDFIDPLEDHPLLEIDPVQDMTELTSVFDKSYPLKLDNQKTKDEIVSWKLEQQGIWFDIPMDKVKDIWLTDFNFFIESQRPRYLFYHIEDVEHKVEWLQENQQSGEIFSLSEFKKTFTPAPLSVKDTFSGPDIIKCADMIERAIQKIDLRTKSAFVKFNTDNGRLESLIIGMAGKLGYKIKSLDKKTIVKESDNGNSVSHLISLK